jgi:hypothetical protein
VEILDEGASVDIFFLDYGEIYTVPIEEVYPMPDNLYNQDETLAIECVLVDVEPIGMNFCAEYQFCY